MVHYIVIKIIKSCPSKTYAPSCVIIRNSTHFHKAYDKVKKLITYSNNIKNGIYYPRIKITGSMNEIRVHNFQKYLFRLRLKKIIVLSTASLCANGVFRFE